MLFLPPVRLSNPDWVRLMQLAFDEDHRVHPVAAFLQAEVHRAIVHEESTSARNVVRLNTSVTYRLDRRSAETRLLVHPEDDVSDSRCLSVFTSLGAALVGIREGDVMPFMCTEGNLHLVTPLAVGRPSRAPVSSAKNISAASVSGCCPSGAIRDGTIQADPWIEGATTMPALSCPEQLAKS